MSTEKRIMGEEVITSSAMHGATGLQECYLKAPHVQLSRGEGLVPQSLLGASRVLTPALGGGICRACIWISGCLTLAPKITVVQQERVFE